MIREIVSIDEQLCNGCGHCVPACAEGAIQIVDGKARPVSDTLCDGLGACLGHCPQGAIKIERREAAEFDEAAAKRQVTAVAGFGGEPRPSLEAATAASGAGESLGQVHGGCPSSRFARFERSPHGSDARGESGCDTQDANQASELTHWPVQLRLLPPTASVLLNARVLVAADCVAVAYAGFHSKLLRDRAVVIACPKLDDATGYVERLAEIIRHNELAELTVAHMEVPCCTGILNIVLQARQIAGSDIPVDDVLISIRGEILARRQIPAEMNFPGTNESACCLNTGAK